MKKCSDEFEKVIKDYLEQRAEVDELFARKFPNPNKSIEKCCDYIISEVSKSGRCGFSDEEIFSIAVHYYDEEDIKDAPHVKCKVVVNRSIELSEEEKENARKQAIKDYQAKVVEDMTKRNSTHKKFIGIVFSFKGLDYHVLKNVEEFVEEGSAMHHCVYNMSYYSKKDTIIIGVRVSDERLATIELNSKKWDIVQCRGVCNKVPDRYDEILEGLNLNLHIFKRAKSSRAKIVSNS